jgi:hypothetical protein
MQPDWTLSQSGLHLDNRICNARPVDHVRGVTVLARLFRQEERGHSRVRAALIDQIGGRAAQLWTAAHNPSYAANYLRFLSDGSVTAVRRE